VNCRRPKKQSANEVTKEFKESKIQGNRKREQKSRRPARVVHICTPDLLDSSSFETDLGKHDGLYRVKVNLYTKGGSGYKQRVHKDNTTYLLGSCIALASGATGGAGAAAHTETGTTEEILVNGEYERMVEN